MCRFRRKDGGQNRRKQEREGGKKMRRGEETEEFLDMVPIFLTRKQNLLEAPTWQTCAYACLAQLVT